MLTSGDAKRQTNSEPHARNDHVGNIPSPDGHLGNIQPPLAMLTVEYLSVLDMEKLVQLNNAIYQKAVWDIYNKSAQVYYKYLEENHPHELMIAILKYSEFVKLTNPEEKILFNKRTTLVDLNKYFSGKEYRYHFFMKEMLRGYYRRSSWYGSESLSDEIKAMISVKKDSKETTFLSKEKTAFLSIEEICALNADQQCTPQLLQAMMRMLYLHPDQQGDRRLIEFAQFAAKTNLAVFELLINTVGDYNFRLSHDNVLYAFYEKKNLIVFKKALQTKGGKYLLELSFYGLSNIATKDQNLEFLKAILEANPALATVKSNWDGTAPTLLMLAIRSNAMKNAHLLLASGADPSIATTGENPQSPLQNFLTEYKKPEIWNLLVTFLKTGGYVNLLQRPFLDFVNPSEKDGLFARIRQLPEFPILFTNYVEWVLNHPEKYSKLEQLQNFSPVTHNENAFLKQVLQFVKQTELVTFEQVNVLYKLFLPVPYMFSAFAKILFDKYVNLIKNNFSFCKELLVGIDNIQRSNLNLFDQNVRLMQLLEYHKQTIVRVKDFYISSDSTSGFFQSKLSRKIELNPVETELSRVCNVKSFWQDKIKFMEDAVQTIKLFNSHLPRQSSMAANNSSVEQPLRPLKP